MDVDPWNWTVAQVADFFRHQAPDYCYDKPNSRLPDPEMFTQILTLNSISGADLLTCLNLSTLRKSCGVSRLGEASSVVHCIEKLRSQSALYSRHLGSTAFPSDYRAVQHEARIDSIHNERHVGLIEQAPIITSRDVSLHQAAQGQISSNDAIITQTNVRVNETEIEDGRGRKRRRLALTAPATFQRQPSLPMETTYLSRAGITVDQIFYGSTPFNQEIRHSSSGMPFLATDSGNDGATDENFSLVAPQGTNARPTGDIGFVHARMLRFMRHEDTMEFLRHGRPATAIYPYRETRVGPNRIRSATVIQLDAQGTDALAYRIEADLLESPEYLQHGDQYHGIETNGTDGGKWTYLLKKYAAKEDDNEICVDAMTEAGAASTSSDFDNESTVNYEDEAEEEKDGQMGGAKIAGIIEQCIEDYVTSWQQNQRERLEARDSRKIWRQMHGSRTARELFIEEARKMIQSLDDRLMKMKRDLQADEWSSERGLRDLCESMRPTVEDRETHRWKIGVWQRRQEPHREAKDLRRSLHRSRRIKSSARVAPIVPIEDRFSLSPAPEDPSMRRNEPASQDYDSADARFHTAQATPVSPIDDGLNGFIVPEGSPMNVLQQSKSALMKSTGIETPQLGRLPTEQANSPDVDGDHIIDHSESLPDVSTFSSMKRHESTPAPVINASAVDNSSTTIIDLTLDSDSYHETPSWRGSQKRTITVRSESPPILPLKRGRKRKPVPLVVKTENAPSANPMEETASAVRSWSLVDLLNRADRQRILIKLVSELSPQVRKTLRELLKETTHACLVQELFLAIEEDCDSDPDDHGHAIVACLYIFCTWMEPESHGKDLDQGKKREHLEFENGAQLRNFLAQLKQVLCRPSFFRSSPEPSRDADGAPHVETHASPHKSRKKKVAQSKQALQSQEKARQRQEEFYTRINELSSLPSSQNMARTGAFQSDDSDILINPLRGEDEDPIYVPSSIGKHLKKHQIDGLQFMWREITAGARDGEDSQGCILAHSMGLGKTVQAITLLACLDRTACSVSPRVWSQLPSNLQVHFETRQLRILILCPPTLLSNWKREIEKWAPDYFRNIWLFESAGVRGQAQQLMNLKSWHKHGGILLIGYQLLTLRLKAGSGAFGDNDGEREYEKYLLEGPDVVVADEVHYLKNQKSDVSQIASQFRTSARIGLTGTPMSNDVAEVYALVSWVAPGYLGGSAEFSGKFTEPIKEGTYEDSSSYEVRRMLKKLAVLRNKIEPKVNRADIKVLRGSLKPKVEFVITVPLLDVPRVAYNRFLAAITAGKTLGNVSQTTLFSWFSVLTLLVNHPYPFKRKLLENVNKTDEGVPLVTNPVDYSSASCEGLSRDSPSSADDTLIGTATPVSEKEDLSSIDDGISDLPADVVGAIVAGITDKLKPELSSKILLLLDILKLSRQCGDKVLVFTSSIPTLEYVVKQLIVSGFRCDHISGQVQASKREKVLEKLSNGNLDVLVISTKAGGVGYNIQCANRVVMLDHTFNPTHEEQAIGRAYRLGQEKPVFVYRLVTGGTFETNVYDKQIFKTTLTSRVVDKKNPVRTTRRQAKDWLYPPQDVAQEDVSSEMNKDPNVLDRIIKDKSGSGSLIRALRTMETLQEEAQDAPLTAEEKAEVDAEIAQSISRFRRARSQQFGESAPPAHVKDIRTPSSTAPPPVAPSSNLIQSPPTVGQPILPKVVLKLPGRSAPPTKNRDNTPGLTVRLPLSSSQPTQSITNNDALSPHPHMFSTQPETDSQDQRSGAMP